MGEQIKLPFVNKEGNYEIRLESIGGLGANLCGKMLGELGVKYLGLNSASFSSYGSEKTGTPVKAYIRYCEADKPIRVHAPVTRPHLLCVFHEALLSDTETCAGCDSDTTVLINTLSKEQNINDKFFATRAVYTVSAQKIAMETQARINTVMLGAMARVMGFVSLQDVCAICEEALGKKYPDALAANLEGIRRGYEEVVLCQRSDRAEKNPDYTATKESHGPKNRRDISHSAVYMPIGGINPYFGNSVINDLSPSRQGYYPIFRPERCINCGLCDSTCPDMVFQFREGIYKGKEMMVNQGLDYHHCKGCLRCVTVCPTQALIKGKEEEHPIKTHFLPDQALRRKPEYYEASASDGYITSESYLTEKRIEGGEI